MRRPSLSASCRRSQGLSGLKEVAGDYDVAVGGGHGFQL